jgi:hypothetical protein
MTDQITLDFSGKLPPSAQAGMEQADRNCNHFWRRMIDAAIVAVARRQKTLTVDDVLDEMEQIPNCPSTHSLAALGPAMSRARRDKIITATNQVVRSKRLLKHGNRHSVWLSNYCGEDKA